MADDDRATASPSPPPVVGQDLICASCGYALAGVSLDARCPECGLSIAATIRGPLLNAADADWLTGVRHGLAFCLIAPVIGIGIVALVAVWSAMGALIGADSAGEGVTGGVVSLAMMLAAGLLCRGWWLITLDEPDAPVAQTTHVLGWMIRASTIGGLVTITLIWMVQSALDWLGSSDAALVLARATIVPIGLFGLVHLVGAMVWFARLAARVPSAKMAREFRRSAWLFVVAGTVEAIHQATGWRPTPVSAVGVGALLALPVVLLNLIAGVALFAAPFWYVVSTLWIWRKLRVIEREASRTASGVATDLESDAPAPP